MASFSKMAAWPVGYFRSTSAWLLRNRREVASRIDTINAEIARIGFVKVHYRRIVTADGSVRVTEEREGFSVTAGSTLERLIQAYVASGGNPYNISGFLHPDTTIVTDVTEDGEPITVEEYPGGGIVAPLSKEYNDPLPVVEADEEGDPVVRKTGYEGYEGGFLNTDRYYPARMGGRVDRGAWDSNTVVKAMHEMRVWANQDIGERLQDLEWRIIKQCDLREQLVRERDEVLAQAFGGALAGLDVFDEDKLDADLRVQGLVDEVAALVFGGAEGVPSARTAEETGFMHFAFPDVPSEETQGL